MTRMTTVPVSITAILTRGNGGGSTDGNGGSENGSTEGDDPPPWVNDDRPTGDDGFPTE